MLTKVCMACINFLKLLCFLHYLLMMWSHIFTGCSQGGKVTFWNMLCTFNGIFQRHSSAYFSGSGSKKLQCVILNLFLNSVVPSQTAGFKAQNPPQLTTCICTILLHPVLYKLFVSCRYHVLHITEILWLPLWVYSRRTVVGFTTARAQSLGANTNGGWKWYIYFLVHFDYTFWKLLFLLKSDVPYKFVVLYENHSLEK